MNGGRPEEERTAVHPTAAVKEFNVKEAQDERKKKKSHKV